MTIDRTASTARALWVLLAAGLAACGGGGGGGGGGSGGSGGGATTYDTAEFRANYGLGRMRLLSAYGAGYNGNGQTIAVIDTGIDVDHPDLDGNLDARSKDIVTNLAANLNDTDGHGTAVAGVAAAERNGTGVHGVAFQANILAIRADARGSCFPNSNCGFDDDDVANALDYARTSGAKVVNLSMGGAAPVGATFRAALLRAVNAGIVVVIAAGNSSGADPLYPARYATDATYLGQVVAVGATNNADAIASFSNRAGVNANAYVVAPGVSIVTTAIGGGTTTVSGTSFSAPHVAGAVALLRQRFPSLTAAQIVDVLLSSTRDLGAAGTDAVYGRGLVDLAAAMAPLGTLHIQLSTGDVLAEGSSLLLGQAFGDALRAAAVLRRVLVFDAFHRDFAFDLRPTVQSARAADAGALESLLLRENQSIAHHRWVGLGQAGFAFAPAQDAWRLVDPAERSRGPSAFWIESDARRGVRAGAYYGSGARGTPWFLAPDAPASSLALPQLGLVGAGAGATMGTSLGRHRVTAAWHQSDTEHSAATLAQLWLDGPLGRSRYALGMGWTRERDAFLGTHASGAFGDLSAGMQFVTAASEVPLAGRIRAFGAVTLADGEPQGGPGLLSDWSSVRSTALVAGVRMPDVAIEGDRLSIAIGQPLRVVRAEVDAVVPVGLAADGSLVQRRERIDARPSGRETVLEVNYGRPLAHGQWTSFMAMRDQPGHIADAPVSGLAGMRLQLPF